MHEKIVLITGAAIRLGAEIARGLHTRGYDLIIHYNKSVNEAEVLSGELNDLRKDSAFLIQTDLATVDNCRALIKQAADIHNRLDVLINNASQFYPAPINELTEHDWQEMVNINLQAPLFLSQSAAPYLKASYGCIINMADIHAEQPLKNHLSYSITKAGLIMLTKALAKELGPEIRVNGISPGAIMWPENMSESDKKDILAKTIMGIKGTGNDVIEAVVYLIENSKYMTGQTMTIDGGRTLYS